MGGSWDVVQADARARFWQGWSQRTGSSDVKQILKAHRKAQKQETKWEALDAQIRQRGGAGAGGAAAVRGGGREVMMDITLHLGDCLEILPTLEYESVDAVITDPPYP
jgi:hypothetical protein